MAVASRKRVLLVEDDDSFREAIGRLLDASDVESVLYASAEALLSDAAMADVACVVSDLKLPGISGLDLLAELRTKGERCRFAEGWDPVVAEGFPPGVPVGVTTTTCPSSRSSVQPSGRA